MFPPNLPCAVQCAYVSYHTQANSIHILKDKAMPVVFVSSYPKTLPTLHTEENIRIIRVTYPQLVIISFSIFDKIMI